MHDFRERNVCSGRRGCLIEVPRTEGRPTVITDYTIYLNSVEGVEYRTGSACVQEADDHNAYPQQKFG